MAKNVSTKKQMRNINEYKFKFLTTTEFEAKWVVVERRSQVMIEVIFDHV